MSEPMKHITRRDIFASWWRWLFFAHANYNWESFQATGFAHAMTPIIRKLYQDPVEIRAALKRHLVLFSTDPEIGGVILGMAIALEEQRASGDAAIDDEAINHLKTNLMGPVGGLGDTLKQGLWFPVWQAIGIGLALSAAGTVTGMLGPLVFIVAALVYTLVFGWLLYYQGYLQGQSLVTRLLNSSLLDDIRTGGAVLGTAVLAALGAEAVNVRTGITWTGVSGAGAAAVRQAGGLQPPALPWARLEAASWQAFDLQKQFLDVLCPSLLPLLTILAIFWLLRRGASGVSVTLYLFGFAFAAALLEAVSRYAIQGGAFGLFSSAGLPALSGILALLGGAFYVGRREKNAAGAMRFVAGFLIVAVLVDLISLGRTDPLQLLAH